MEDIFISHIHINQVRHLKNLDIPLSATERQHLILTGKNGSGKTSVLEQMKLNFEERLKAHGTKIADIPFLKTRILNLEESINTLKESLLSIDEDEALIVQTKILNIEKSINKDKAKIQDYGQIQLELKNISDIRGTLKFKKDFFTIREGCQNGDFILAFFDAKRTILIKKPNGVNKISVKNNYAISEKASTDFLQYIVNMKADRSFARDENDLKTITDVDNWFTQFENSLKQIFGENDLKLRFDRKNYNFDIVLNGHDVFDFMTLSDGYSAVLNIVIEIMMRMENKSSRNYDIQGIVLIDEIETHLHIDLQKKILPFLTAFFPKIQFIVTTHSPFVLTSVKNAVVYDLEKQEALTDLSGYSVEAIIESYFGQDKYANVLTEKVNQYEKLMSKNGLSEAEREEKRDLKGYFKNLPYFLAPELQVKIQQIELAQLGK